jgi:carboxyl-terminal processing protease
MDLVFWPVRPGSERRYGVAGHRGRRFWPGTLTVVVLGMLTTPARAEPGEAAAALVRRAEALEKEERWAAAADLYAEALRLPGAPADLLDRARRCQRQDQIARRYADPGAQAKLLRLTLDDALDLYAEVLAKIQAHYVEEVEWDPLAAQGLDGLGLALANRAFVQAVLPPGVTEEALQRCRQTLPAAWGKAAVKDRRDLLRRVRALAGALRQEAGARPAAVVLEFVHAAAEALDPYSAYLPPDRFAMEKALARPDLAGVGLDLTLARDQILIAGVVADGPAARAHLQINQQLVSIDGQAVRPLGLEEAALKLLGPENSTVVIEVQGALDRAPRKVDLVRRRLTLPSVTEVQIVERDPPIGYLHLGFFQDTTLPDLDAALTRLVGEGARAVILDLRGNPGGRLDAAIEVADRFLAEGVVVSTRGRSPGTNVVYRAREEREATLPLVLLIDGETASAAEIVAGALKDHRRAVLVGQRTAGKGSIQHVFPLRSAASGLRLTTAKFFSPLDVPIAPHGVTPDVTVDRVPEGDFGASMMGLLQLQRHQFDAAVRAAKDLLTKP